MELYFENKLIFFYIKFKIYMKYATKIEFYITNLLLKKEKRLARALILKRLKRNYNHKYF